MPLKEKLIIERIRRASLMGRNRPFQGIGDDCAVVRLPRAHEALLTTDLSLEDVHFKRAWHPADSVGHRSLTRGLSDIAAMGGIPQAVFLSLAVPKNLKQRWIDEFVRGLLLLADRHGVTLSGGDTAQSPNRILVDMVVLGSAPTGKSVLRSGARPGDLLYVTGTLGSSVATLEELRQGKKLRPKSHLTHFYPEPRVAIGQYLREKKIATAMIDISDGLSTDLGHICDESKIAAVIYENSLPLAFPGEPLELALHGGEEYELLFAARPNRQVPTEIGGVPITRIGEILPGSGIRLAKADGKMARLKPGGWQHFA
jgi:thiamine-monophosphate kinase